MSGRAGRLGLALVVVAGVTAAGCAARAPRTFADRFVVPDTGTSADATYDVEPERSTSGSRQKPLPRRDAVPIVPVPKVSPGPTLESEIPALGDALAALAVRETADGHRRAAAEYWRARVFDRADRHLSRAIALRPRDAALFEERARMWRDAGVLERALSDAHQAVYLAPGRPAAQNTLGTVLYALGQYPAARERFARAVALDPGAAYAQSNLCLAALARGVIDEARAACDEALRLEPQLKAAQLNRERVEAALIARQDTQP